jgi:hypothetical protein
MLRAQFARMGIEYADVGVIGREIGDFPPDLSAIRDAMARKNTENRGVGADAAIQVTHEAIGAINQQTIGRGNNFPSLRQRVAGPERSVDAK